MDENKSRFQYEALKWMYELEMLEHPQLINNLKMNVMIQSKSIKEVELLIYREKKSILVLIELSWFGRKFKRKSILSDVHEGLSQLLPTFRFRVTEDPKIMEMAVEQVKRALTGGNVSEIPNVPASNPDPIKSDESATPATESSVLSDSQEQSKAIDVDTVRSFVDQSDSREE